LKFTNTRVCVSLSVLALLAVRCNGDSTNNNDGGNDSGGNDVANGTDTGTDSGKDGTASKPYVGGVNLTESKTGTVTSMTASAGFYTSSGTGTPGCTGTSVMSGNCCYTPPAAPSDGGVVTPTAVGAGVITLKDATATIATMTPTGTAYTAVTNPPTVALTWAPGDSIAIAAVGDTVHAFSGTVTAAALFAAINPAFSFTATAVSRAADYVVTWTSGTGNITLIASALKGTASDGVIICTATDTGTMTLPTALLTKFTANDTGSLSLSRTISSDASVDNATITLASSTSALGLVTYP
jgi:hypothetical protein